LSVDEGRGPGARGAVRLVPLGGLGEIGMNCLAVEQDDEIVVVDCGVSFPTTDLGIDVYHPRFDYLLARRDQVRAIVLTHGHEDHIGALPYLLDHLDVPVFGPQHALELAKMRLGEHGFDVAGVDLRAARPGAAFDAGPFSIEPIRVTHSIADATGLAIRTSAGLIVHTGDFKLDGSPPDGELTDEARFRELGREGVRLLLSDSTNVDSPGSTTSEQEVADTLAEIVAAAPHRVVVGVFASNVQRLLSLGRIAERTRRRVCLFGRSMVNHVRAAQQIGRLSWRTDLVVPPELAASMPRDRVLVLASGTQAERTAALVRLATGTHPMLRLDEGDTVILSSRVIPGNDRPVSELVSSFLRLGVRLVTRVTDRRVHASGHAHRDEQLRMIEMTSPEAFVPVHGTLHHLMRHAELARDAGVGDALVVESGEPVELGAAGPLARAGRVLVGRVATAHGEELSDEVLRERAQLGRAGVGLVSLVLDATGALAAPPRVALRGVPGGTDASRLIAVSKAVARAIEATEGRPRMSDDATADLAARAARRALEQHVGVRTSVSAVVTRVGAPRASPARS
jgi:ribonuclease J